MLNDWEADVLANWQSGAFDRAGKAICRHVDGRLLGRALTQVVRDLGAMGGKFTFEDYFLAVIGEENLWPQACNVFSVLRAKTLQLERSGKAISPEGSLLGLQENMAKHLCNMSSNLGRFDEDSGEWAVICLAQVLQSAAPDVSASVRTRFLDHISGRATH